MEENPMTPQEFVLWMNGVAGVLADTPPSLEQWKRIQEKTGLVMAKMAAERLAGWDLLDKYRKLVPTPPVTYRRSSSAGDQIISNWYPDTMTTGTVSKY